jgi:energy-coupling factor transport system permease protein
VLAVVTSIVAVALGGVLGPAILIVAAVFLPAAIAGELRAVLRLTLLLALPLAVSAALVNLFFYPGGADVLLRIGPITATAEGAAFAAGIVMRILVIAGAVTLFYRTTRIAELVADLERRGVPARIAFVTSSAVATVPAMVDRAATITAAQRARGLDTEGSPWRRIRGIVPIVAPTVLGAINEVEERTMALEARGFTRPGRRTLLWHPPDPPRERLARWVLVLLVPLAVAAPSLGLRLP